MRFRAVLALIFATLAAGSTSYAAATASVELPADIRQALEASAQSLAAGQTIEWNMVRSSPMTIAAGKKYISGTPAEVEQMLRGIVHVAFTSQADLRFLEHVLDKGAKPAGGQGARTEDTKYSFDGTTHFTHVANSGEEHGLSWATQDELQNIDVDQMFLLDETYFAAFAVSMSTTPKSIGKKRPPRSLILNLLEYGAQLSNVDQVRSENQNRVRLKIDATDNFSATDIGWEIGIFPLGVPLDIASTYYYLDPQNNYDVVRSEHFDASGFKVMQIDCSDYEKVDPRPVSLPKTCVIQQFAPKHNGAIETETITFKSISTKPLPVTSFTLHDNTPGTYIIQHKSTDHQKVFIVQKNGTLKPQRDDQ
jgi:hypothetical protein